MSPTSAIGRGAVNEEFAIDVEIQSLVESLAANIRAELNEWLSNDLADTVRPLERVPHLRQLAFAIVADREPAAYLNKWKPFVLRTQIGMNSAGIVGRAVCESKARARGKLVSHDRRSGDRSSAPWLVMSDAETFAALRGCS